MWGMLESWSGVVVQGNVVMMISAYPGRLGEKRVHGVY
jgi:hypothetical protein